ncbi:type 1 fimbrial protein [Salmonella enterica]|nr:type 1 fimbrial protein [Citrobacter werkmanii]EHG1308577.1 type 1 fimbrial protein [Salmonella enterica]EHH6165069.1 type 1 fimbrial protein [Salmonella enterica]EHO7416037.1 type 1 fimbrial protein [Salmonella enterica]EHP0290046.1 type 1 fimbrial protein [Salmonella enterica]
MARGYLLPKVLPFLLMHLWGTAVAADYGHGRVSMNGSIIDTACSIDLDSQYQDIDMMPVPVDQVVRDGRGPEVPFTIRLVDCSLAHWHSGPQNWSSLRVTFDGATIGSGLFWVAGEARGVGLQIVDANGVAAVPGSAMPPRILQPGSMDLVYTLRLMKSQMMPVPGDWHTTLRFKMDYF